jgi:hypothetical protein
MCQQLGSIGRTVGKDVVLKSVLDELFELMKDEENQVGGRGEGGVTIMTQQERNRSNMEKVQLLKGY